MLYRTSNMSTTSSSTSERCERCGARSGYSTLCVACAVKDARAEARLEAMEEVARLCDRRAELTRILMADPLAANNPVWIELLRGNLNAFNAIARDIRLFSTPVHGWTRDTVLVAVLRAALFAEDYATSKKRNAMCNAPDELTAKDVADGYRDGYQTLHALVSNLWTQIERLPPALIDAARKRTA